MLAILFLSCAEDSHPERLIIERRNYQTRLLQGVFGNLSFEDFEKISNGMPLKQICQWKNIAIQVKVVCRSSGLVKLLRVCNFHGGSGRSIGQMDIGFLPPSITDLDFHRCSQKQHISTRLLPSNSRKINLRTNYYFGSLDLSDLPKNLKRLNLSDNCFTGPINLCFLPKDTTWINLKNNEISQDALFYGDLRKAVIFLEGNSIGGLYAISSCSKAYVTSFPTMTSKIH